MRNDPLIPNLAVVTDIRVDTPDVKTFRVVGLDGKKALRPYPRPVRHALCSRCRRSAVLHHVQSHAGGICGVFH